MSNPATASSTAYGQPCPAVIVIDGRMYGCDTVHDPHSGNPDEAQHTHDLANWQIRWDDWHSQVTEGTALNGPSAQPTDQH